MWMYYLLSAVLGMLIFFVVVAWIQPSNFRVVRSVKIAATAPVVFKHVNNFHMWEAWSPWAKIDPAMKQYYEGPPAGVGASHAWKGNNQVGEGRTTITESRPAELIRLRLEFVRPFQCNNEVEFSFQSSGSDTLVTWSMTGHNKFIAKAFGLLMNMDKMVGGQFEQGLAQLKAVAETESRG